MHAACFGNDISWHVKGECADEVGWDIETGEDRIIHHLYQFGEGVGVCVAVRQIDNFGGKAMIVVCDLNRYLLGQLRSGGCAIGLVHMAVPPERLDETLQEELQELESGAPQAIRSCKALSLTIGRVNDESARSYTSELIARLRVSEEGQEGLSAFLEKRPPSWKGR